MSRESHSKKQAVNPPEGGVHMDYPGYSIYYDLDDAAFKAGIKQLENEGFHQTQRPHHKLPALMNYWEKLLEESGYPMKWFSKKIEGRQADILAVAGAHLVERVKVAKTYLVVKNEMTYCIRIFGDYETEKYERSH